jgi:hypothetical protein
MDPPPLDAVIFDKQIKSYKPVLRDFFNNDATDFSNYRFISQGEVGDCWLLAPIAALARSPQLRGILQRNFTINADNTYTIKLYTNGAAKDFRINGTLYVIPKKGKWKADLLFAGQQQFLPERDTVGLDLLWYAFIEKAVAILYGGYNSLDGGEPNSPTVKQADLGFRILTNRVVRTVPIVETTDFNGEIKTLLAAGAAIVFTTKANTEVPALKAMKNDPTGKDRSGFNLLEDHAYVLDSISEDGSLKLYNPHGEFPALEINKAAILSEADARFFGKRLDILPGGARGGRKTRRRRTLNKLRLAPFH